MSFVVWTEPGRRAAKAGRPRPSVRWAGRLWTHSGRGSVLGKGIGREGGAGPAWAGRGGRGRRGVHRRGLGAAESQSWSAALWKDEVPSKRRSAGVCHCLRDNCDGDGLAVLRALPFNLSSVTLSLFLFFFSVCGWMVGGTYRGAHVRTTLLESVFSTFTRVTDTELRPSN